MLSLAGIVIVIVGFLIRANPLLVVAFAAIVTGLACGLDLVAVVSAFGKAFNEDRYVSIPWLVLPVIGVLERYGLQERARQLIGGLKAAAPGRLLLAYLAVRQIASALGLTSLGGHAQMVRPLVAPMAEAAAEQLHGDLSETERQSVLAQAAATDNVGLFFGEDIFIAVGSILLIKGFLEQNGIIVSPLSLSVWAIPTALAAFVIHGFRLLLLDRRLRRNAGKPR